MSDVSQLVDPRTGQDRGLWPRFGASDVSSRVSIARAAACSRRHDSPKTRADRLDRLAAQLSDEYQAYVSAEQSGTGKPPAEALAEVEQAIDLFRFYGWAARTQFTPASGQIMPGHESWVRWEPVGLVGAIVPWNYPLLMAAWRIAPALAAGNVVILKPAETTPDSALLLEEHSAAVLEAGLLQCLPGDRATGRLLVSSDIDAIAFTGSVPAGYDVAKRSGIRPHNLELGGNCPAIVLPDCAPETFDRLADAAIYNAGQSCAAPTRIITLHSNYEQVIGSIGSAMSQRQAGRHFGPLNNPSQLRRYDAVLARTKAGILQQGTIAIGDTEQNGYWRPTAVLADLADDDIAVTTEIFAPVLTVQSASDVENAIELANGQPYSLAGSVWSRQISIAIEVASRMDVGEAWINCHLVQTAELPHGGHGGSSGSGTDLSVLALNEYQRPKTITCNLEIGR